MCTPDDDPDLALTWQQYEAARLRTNQQWRHLNRSQHSGDNGNACSSGSPLQLDALECSPEGSVEGADEHVHRESKHRQQRCPPGSAVKHRSLLSELEEARDAFQQCSRSREPGPTGDGARRAGQVPSAPFDLGRTVTFEDAVAPAVLQGERIGESAARVNHLLESWAAQRGS